MTLIQKMKKLLAMALALAMLAGIAPISVLASDQPVGTGIGPLSADSLRTQAEALEWINNQLGIRHGDGECIYFVQEYIKFLTGSYAYTTEGRLGNGKDFDEYTHVEALGWTKGVIAEHTVL